MCSFEFCEILIDLKVLFFPKFTSRILLSFVKVNSGCSIVPLNLIPLSIILKQMLCQICPIFIWSVLSSIRVENFRIQSKWGEVQNRKNAVSGHFSRSKMLRHTESILKNGKMSTKWINTLKPGVHYKIIHT